MTISFYLEKSKARKRDGKLPVYVSLSCHLGRLRRPTSVYVSPANWDERKSQVKSKEALSAHLNSIINTLSTNIQTIFAQNANLTLAEVDLEILKITKKEVANELTNLQNELGELTFSKFVDIMCTNQQHELSKNTFAARKHLAGLVHRFEPDVLLDKINETWLLSFRNWLATTGVINNSINLYISRLNVVLKYAYKNKYISSPPAKINVLKHRTTPVTIYLSEDELNAFEEYVIQAGRDANLLQIAKDYFLFMCYTGIRYSDFFLLTKANIKSSSGKYAMVLEYVAKKNNMHVICPLTAKAIAIINKYRADTSDFIFPQISKTSLFFKIKKIAKNSGINALVLDAYYMGNELIQVPKPKYELISAHAGRHTFATLYIAKKGNIIYLQKFLGHTNLDMTRKYVELMKSNLDDDFFSVFGK